MTQLSKYALSLDHFLQVIKGFPLPPPWPLTILLHPRSRTSGHPVHFKIWISTSKQAHLVPLKTQKVQKIASAKQKLRQQADECGWPDKILLQQTVNY